MYSSGLIATAIALASSQSAFAWFRVACTTPLVSERVDPVISPGVIPSNHVHTIHGGQNFAANATFDTLRASSCTSCLVTQDDTNYWFPKLYFRDPTTQQYEEVSNGGLLVYYQNRGDLDVSNGGPGLKAFPAGFKMISGNPARRGTQYSTSDPSQAALAERAQFFSCLRYTDGVDGYDGYGFPTTNCEAGLNARIHFPACWDGVNLDSSDHTSHTAFLSELDNGACPDTHPVGLMKLLYEVTWDINAFADRWDTTNSSAWPFVYATGDPTGLSWHGDFQNGWDVTALQNAIDDCNNPNDETWDGVTEACSYLTVQQSSVASTCKAQVVVDETVGGDGIILDRLPGCNPLQYGPEDATYYSDSNCPTSGFTF
ncbi:uncharacterized protein STEHIDRAFT_98994 [Stereum hirsutum FP-91666 SS1]|uniref:uncharacterized protein n=1 Tax=Stereum hirsutum (strain FP-91666) TaxID=721885 RepID=UPI0004449D6F|nr:uncharacterized protein STEHIDRAFT_98994 [Stereum hirsutum FP-91666 SS1]EIM85455.1 hypothetical protein STEHIDRAFT_98994 [Stereum hirsutum FP-91666 SS1]